ncbi:hypothetical protein J5N97_010134 [Dioscorea zingiberensis]|uniref:Uncharacterized protein n=1 Tax=Dioscorea zingiberensis TaxID=325984 RepID=A0A9D5CZN2_9LILI|nr:hypothetical protein J5N97_010134 [Dioscorea zingiberensis]
MDFKLVSSEMEIMKGATKLKQMFKFVFHVALISAEGLHWDVALFGLCSLESSDHWGMFGIFAGLCESNENSLNIELEWMHFETVDDCSLKSGKEFYGLNCLSSFFKRQQLSTMVRGKRSQILDQIDDNTIRHNASKKLKVFAKTSLLIWEEMFKIRDIKFLKIKALT